MLYNNLLFFLGFYSWNFKHNNFLEYILKKKNINLNLLNNDYKNNKKLFKIYEQDTVSPHLNLYANIINLNELNFKSKLKIYLYNLYSFIIFCFISIQPIYLFYNIISNSNDNIQEYFLTFLIDINTPITYIWAKIYFNTNHFELFINSCQFNCWSYIILLLILTFISIIISLFNINLFYNEFYFINYFNKNTGIIIVIIEWIYVRILFALTSSTFTIVFCQHIKQIRNFIKKILSNEIDLEDSYCLSSLINNIGSLRYSVEISIKFFNKFISVITITGGISITIFIRHQYYKFIDENVIIFTNHEYYLLQSYILYIICQIIFYYNIFKYADLRDNLVKLIQSSFFINKFLTRWPISKIMKKCKDTSEIKELTKIILCIEQENASSIDWMILEKLTINKWMDFSILGISTQDGTLIKKVFTFSSLIYIILSYFN